MANLVKRMRIGSSLAKRNHFGKWSPVGRKPNFLKLIGGLYIITGLINSTWDLVLKAYSLLFYFSTFSWSALDVINAEEA